MARHQVEKYKDIRHETPQNENHKLLIRMLLQ